LDRTFNDEQYNKKPESLLMTELLMMNNIVKSLKVIKFSRKLPEVVQELQEEITAIGTEKLFFTESSGLLERTTKQHSGSSIS